MFTVCGEFYNFVILQIILRKTGAKKCITASEDVPYRSICIDFDFITEFYRS
jgi:hypothetical protein